eukprot:TRINITY_DN20603_c0_g1_i3.p1 TRINITY_DN20603_c0_g1~~TRINITY_DN20603_c0_g1_i3.p1  ORF type:complete len:157 (+),score=8.37 TRINITY_DN20603_c0_g1_i3:97-567(+)
MGLVAFQSRVCPLIEQQIVSHQAASRAVAHMCKKRTLGPRKGAQEITIVVGGTSREDYEKMLPPNSFIYAEDFKSFDQLAEHLLMLNRDAAEYNKYHEWRYKYRGSTKWEGNAQAYCKLCGRLHSEPASVTPRKTHTSLTSWWFDGACKQGYPAWS